MQNSNSSFSSISSNGLKIVQTQGHQNLLALHQSNPQRYPFLLESVATSNGHQDHSASSHFDILFAFPQQTLTLSSDEKLSGYSQCEGHDFLNTLSQWWQATHNDSIECNDLPFSGGWFLYLGYELAKQVEPQLKLKKTTTPIAYATRIPAVIIYDHKKACTYALCEEAFNYLEELTTDIENNPQLVNSTLPAQLNKIIEEDETRYLNAIQKVKQYIIDGDIFQANLSRLWTMDGYNLNAIDIYQKLRKTNPAPFSGLAVHNNFSIISSSPERLISVKSGHAETRPIAGTRRRELDKEKDQALKAELIAHPKERAEHIMLIDLERNDLGRICIPGSIKVDEFMVLESYAHVHHIVSNVCGQLNKNILPGDIIKAVFPGGTITGCPKVRCMEIIAELEHEARGAYTGSMGYLNHNGDMDLNILIRTMTLEGNRLSFRAGAGLVADSVAQSELEETRHKARGLLLAIQQ
jgi:anthranilate synthase component 1